MKKIMTIVVTILMMVVMTMPAMAASQEEMRVRNKVAECEYEIYSDLAEDDLQAFNRATEITVKSYHLGNNIYDVVIGYKIYKKYVYELHMIYDAVEDEELTDYGIYDGKRMTSEELSDLIISKHPELNLR